LADGSPREHAVHSAFGRRNLLPRAFIRGDANSDANVDIADALAIFGHLFLGHGELECPDAADADDSAVVDITDGIYVLGHLFLGGPAPRYPYPFCGWDLSIADGLGCWQSPCRLFPSFDR
jgi:hypothetical protein